MGNTFAPLGASIGFEPAGLVVEPARMMVHEAGEPEVIVNLSDADGAHRLGGARHSRRPLKAVLFDKDGTLLDFHATWVPILRNVALDLADGDEAAAGRLLAIGGFNVATGRVTAGSALAAGNTRDIVDLWYPSAGADRKRALAERIDAAFRTGSVACAVPVAGLLATLDTLAERGYLLGVATSDATATARAGLDAIGVVDRFSCILGYDAVRRPKPAPDMVAAFCQALLVDPADIAVVGDSCHDLAMARSAGAGAAIGVLGGTSGPSDLAPLADAILDGIDELPRWLANNSLPRTA